MNKTQPCIPELKYRLLLLDIDGTLRPQKCTRIPLENVEEVQRIRRLGVQTAIATGRGRNSVPDAMLNGLSPDFWICAEGAQILTEDGKELFASRMSQACMDALLGFADQRNFPLGFSFDDGLYFYRSFSYIEARNRAFGMPNTDKDCPNRNRHLQGMPFSAVAFPTQEDIQFFTSKYKDLGLRFAYFNIQADDGRIGCDILRPDQDKANALDFLCRYLHIPTTSTVAAGDGYNDIGMLKAAGLSYAMNHSLPEVKKAANRIPSPQGYEIANMCWEIWPV